MPQQPQIPQQAPQAVSRQQNHRELKSNAASAQAAQQHSRAQEAMQWVYVNGLGERDMNNVSDTDILTAMNFDSSGEYLAVGDKGGRVIVFRFTDLKNSRYLDYRYFSEI